MCVSPQPACILTMVEKTLGSVGNRPAIPRLSIQQPDHSHNVCCTSIYVLNIYIFNILIQFIRFEACAAVCLRPSLLWDFTQLVFSLGLPKFKVTQSGRSVHEECLTLEDWTGRLSRNIGKELPT